jgi:NAD(P)-dependent dehydrogenase (short-subunit alcohol dehydrogenase family)
VTGRLAGKAALITGATSGRGADVVRRFAAEGARIVFCGRTVSAGEALAAELGPAARFVRADVTDETDIAALTSAARDLLGGHIDFLFNNAAPSFPERPITEMRWEEVEAAQTAIFGSVVMVTKHVARVMIEQGGGSILNNGSSAAHRANSSPSIYSALKAGVCHLTRCLALELAEHGVRVNTVSPGAVPTPIFLSGLPVPPERQDAAVAALSVGFASAVPLGRAGRGADIASAAVFFASDESGFVTGQDLVVDGGLTAGLSSAARRAQSDLIRSTLLSALG